MTGWRTSTFLKGNDFIEDLESSLNWTCNKQIIRSLTWNKRGKCYEQESNFCKRNPLKWPKVIKDP